MKERYNYCRKRSLLRVKYLLGYPDIELENDNEYFYDIDEYGLGTERTLNDYWNYVGWNPGMKKGEKGRLIC